MKQYSQDVVVNGDHYVLQHPGVLAWSEQREQMMVISADGEGNSVARMAISRVLSYAFENVVFPTKGSSKLSLKTWDPRNQAVLTEVWQPLLLNFLGGKEVARINNSRDWTEPEDDLPGDEEPEPAEAPGGRTKQSDLEAGNPGTGSGDVQRHDSDAAVPLRRVKGARGRKG